MTRLNDDDEAGMVECAPVLPDRWRELLASARQRGILSSPQHQWAYRNFVCECFPDHVSTTDRDVLDQIEAWWVLVCLRHDGWRYYLTARIRQITKVGDFGNQRTPDEAER